MLNAKFVETFDVNAINTKKKKKINKKNTNYIYWGLNFYSVKKIFVRDFI